MATKKEPQKKGHGEFNSSPKTNIGYFDGLTFYSKPIQYAEVDGLAIFEGDIILGTIKEIENKTNMRGQELRGEIQRAAVITGAQYRWTDCTIPYTIDSGLTNQNRVTDAIAHWEANTNVRFVLRTSSNSSQYPDYVTFRSGSGGCSSYVGKIGGQQYINLGSGCATGNAIHEIGHTVGLWHEQSREDRDSFVTIHWDKIQAGYENNFTQKITDGDDIGTYDYGSIMHYPRNAFSIDGTDTITPINPASAQIGQRNALSAGDIAAVNTIYTCSQGICSPGPFIACPSPVITCAAGPTCKSAPLVQCAAAPVRPCPPAPLRCPPAPFTCPPAPVRCPPAPHACPPAPRLTCPPAIRIAGCRPAPAIGPGPLKPEIYGRGYPAGMDPYGNYAGVYCDPYGYPMNPYAYGSPYEYGAGYYADPYGYGSEAGYSDPYQYPNWTAYEYPDPYQYGYQGSGYNYPRGRFNPYYWR